MAYTEKLQHILDQLRLQQGPVSISALMVLLDEAINERTLRRWLADFIDQGLVRKVGQGRSTQYEFIRPAKTISTHTPVTLFSPESLALVDQIDQPVNVRTPVSYHKAWLENYIPNKTAYVDDALKAELLTAGERDGADAAGTYARKIYNRLLIDLSYNSSRLEGNTYSLLDTQRLLLESKDAPDKLDEEKIMILNHKEAIRYLVDNSATVTINETTIKTLHFLLADGLLPTTQAGSIRNHGVRISQGTYYPLESQVELEQLLQMICGKAALIEHPFEQSFFLLVHLAYLQAFSDVNKRTSRLSASIPLIKHNLVPLSFNDIDKDDYIRALLVIYELNEVQPMLDLYRYSYLRTCKLYE